MHRASASSRFFRVSGVRDMGAEKVHDFPALRQNAHFVLSFEGTHFVLRFWHWKHARSDGVALLFRMALISERNVAYMMKAHQIAEYCGKRQESKSSRRSRVFRRQDNLWRGVSHQHTFLPPCERHPFVLHVMQSQWPGRLGRQTRQELTWSYTLGQRVRAKYSETLFQNRL